MPSTFGNALRVTVFGQSHSQAVGCVVEGLPSGHVVDMEALGRFMARRAPGQGPWTTPRKEADLPRIVSGLNPRGATCGAPLAIVIENTNTRSRDYDNLMAVPRPGHADYTAWAKWHGNQDVPGGGHFSGRLTAPLCAAGGIALQMLAERGVRVGAHLLSVADVRDEPLCALDNAPASQVRLQGQLDALTDGRTFPTIDAEAGKAMLAAIDDARRELDSVGGVVECVATGMPAGVGSPMFDGIENLIARAAFGVPAVKGVEFGRGFEAARLRGSEDNDPYRMVDGTVTPVTNNAGGALGGITTGAPVLFRMALKPTSSISRPQESVDLTSGSDATLEVHGRHDPCVATRAVPVAEAICALSLLDALLSFPPEPEQ
ncbi:chorismate synthase [Parafannyhessea umbonata]|jgi:chorismate synthase|uniref:chorismate synthase n=1 Tax=Parafannyhessea umbonata TaxID=604330 RepID=UPI0026F2BB10|nr:chorismate synthase [Parafannyhessea umbonata]MCI6681538.1 chorismate synthase [Parafannyhessea umbonata]MCI7219124.1 chorismate synthase [Parafannyhessea umbonata]